MAIFSAGRIIGGPVIGYWSDKRSHKEVLLGTIAIITLGSVMYTLSPNIATMLIARTIIGFGGGTYIFFFQSHYGAQFTLANIAIPRLYVRRHTSLRVRTLMMSINTSLQYAGAFLSPGMSQ